MKPLIRTVDNSIHDGSGGYISQIESLIPLANESYLFTADQLRQAKVACLRSAAKDFRYSNGTEGADDFLFRMADAIEKGE